MIVYKLTVETDLQTGEKVGDTYLICKKCKEDDDAAENKLTGGCTVQEVEYKSFVCEFCNKFIQED